MKQSSVQTQHQGWCEEPAGTFSGLCFERQKSSMSVRDTEGNRGKEKWKDSQGLLDLHKN